jgi:hypothetical protein
MTLVFLYPTIPDDIRKGMEIQLKNRKIITLLATRGGWVTFKWKSLITEEKFNYFLFVGKIILLPYSSLFLRLMVLFIRLRNKLPRNNLLQGMGI